MHKLVMNSIFQDSAQYGKSHDVHVFHVAIHSRPMQTIRSLYLSIRAGLNGTLPQRLQPVSEGGLINSALGLSRF